MLPTAAWGALERCVLRLANSSGSFQDVHKFCKCIQAMAKRAVHRPVQGRLAGTTDFEAQVEGNKHKATALKYLSEAVLHKRNSVENALRAAAKLYSADADKAAKMPPYLNFDGIVQQALSDLGVSEDDLPERLGMLGEWQSIRQAHGALQGGCCCVLLLALRVCCQLGRRGAVLCRVIHCTGGDGPGRWGYC